MDKHEVKRLALLGAAKVAFSATLVGCGGVVTIDTRSGDGGTGGMTSSGTKPVPWMTTAATSDATAVATTAASTTSASTTSATTGTGVFGGECGVPPSGPYADSTITCCNTMVESTFPQGAPPPPNVSSDVVACCNVVLTQKPGTAGGVPWATAYQCCSVPGVTVPPGASACTPWGPPVPPSMPADLDWLEEAA